MSEENLKLVRRVVEWFQTGLERGDPSVWFDLEEVRDDCEWTLENATRFEGQSVWRGRDRFREFMRTWTSDFERWSVRVELIDAGDDRVVGLTHQSAVGKGSRVPVDLPMGQVYELEDGQLARVRNYLGRHPHAEALEAAGLSE
jgi:ketosteroid isomerase-like protein